MGSTEPEISIPPPPEKDSQVYMVVEDDNVVEVRGAQNFTKFIEPRRRGWIHPLSNLTPLECGGQEVEYIEMCLPEEGVEVCDPSSYSGGFRSRRE